jgi:preprotein translocase subunit YajC
VGGSSNGSAPSRAPTNSTPEATAEPSVVGGRSNASIPPNVTETTAPNATAVEPNVTALPTIVPTANRTNTSTNKNSSSCFPAVATVELESGTIKRMDEIVVGDRVKISSGVFSEVFMFTHKVPTGVFDFIRLATTSGNSLALSAGHYIHVNGGLVSAASVVVGDTLQLGTGELTTVTFVSQVTSTGLYNPQTLDGDIVVDGIRASTYTTAVEPRLAHAGLSPLRALYRSIGFSCTSFNKGADSLANMLPSGVSLY